MDALYIVAGPIAAGLWIGLLYLLVLEPIRLCSQDRRARQAEPGVSARVAVRSAERFQVRWGGGSYRDPRRKLLRLHYPPPDLESVKRR